jgi:hypothetical protein
MSDDAAWWPSESPPDDLVEATVEFCRLLRRSGWEPSVELVDWVGRRDAQLVLSDTPLRP